jgi:hypothetical protein
MLYSAASLTGVAGLRRPVGRSNRSVGSLKPYANNPRLHREADLGKIAASILKWGWTMPVLVDEHGELIFGHARVGAAIILELKSIPVIVAKGWSEEEKRACRVADNQLAARASWDPGCAPTSCACGSLR